MVAAFVAMGLLQEREVAFSYKPKTKVSTVHVVGPFNAWDKARNPLVVGKDGTWRATVKIAPGVYPYLFVEDGQRWIPDPGKKTDVDANGNKASILVVQPTEFDKYPAKVGDGVLTLGAIKHEPKNMTIRRNQDEFVLQVRTRANDVQRVHLVTSGNRIAMRPVSKDQLYWLWQSPPFVVHGETLSYSFQVDDFNSSAMTTLYRQRISKYAVPSPPGWVEDAVFYQIFPDRFADGDRNASSDFTKAPAPRGWLGGDLKGVSQHVDHLKNLGVNAVYLNPIFTAQSYHGYDTTDYMTVDPHFGTNDQFHQLVEDLHDRGVRIVLDGVFNHTSPDFFAFKDIVEKGASSAYNDWYTIYKHPVEVKEGQQTYLGWAGVYNMPKLRTDQPEVQTYILGVAENWIKSYGIDGWRLDVADEVYPPFWIDFRKAVKKANPEAWIVGEEWGDAHQYLQGDKHDSVMNYRWRTMALDFFVDHKTSPWEFSLRLGAVRQQYPEAVERSVYNLLGSHDTPRIKTLCKGDGDLLRQLVAFQFTYPGVPSIYYGDEVGMEGGYDPDCRRGMDWSQKTWDLGLLDFYRRLIALRKSEPALRHGKFNTYTEDRAKVFAFTRELGNEQVFAAFNASRRKQGLPYSLKDWETLMEGHVERKGDKVWLGSKGFIVAKRHLKD
ncbi:MAG: DUF3459 domain-containing protein [Armatimonadetes bacterium]|nr:DUF3459 domain-containing protein [Armatimonadota bacterium]